MRGRKQTGAGAHLSKKSSFPLPFSTDSRQQTFGLRASLLLIPFLGGAGFLLVPGATHIFVLDGDRNT
ncbi:hypothetical protein ACFL1G_00410 [Planctomycetota bacterium]